MALFLILTTYYIPALHVLYSERVLIVLSYFATIPVVIAAVRALIRREITVDLLASIALFASLMHGEWISVIFINLLITSANIFSTFTENRSRVALETLLKLRPSHATVERDRAMVEVPLEEVAIGDLVYVGLGERVPIDGVIERGEATIDRASLTGESLPVSVAVGDRALSSTIVASGNIVVRADHVGKDTTFEKMVALIEQAQQNKAGISTIADRFGKWYIILTLIGAGLIYLIFRDLTVVLSLLLVSCADDVAIAIPTAFLVTISTEARQGVIVKGGDFLEGLAYMRTLIVDKTGTLTKGQLRVEEIVPFSNTPMPTLLEYAGVAGRLSRHPSAQAICRYVDEKHIAVGQPDVFVEQSGKGAVAAYHGKQIVTGKAMYLKEHLIELTEHDMAIVNAIKDKGYNVTLIGCDGALIGVFALADELRPDAAYMVKKVKEAGVQRVVMLTGDNEKIAARVAKDVGITEFRANLLPEDKLSYIQRSRHSKHKVAMIGDGVNDAAALTLAD
ncbi:MAG TPA: heavy metal translocating P-type ATPase, partial [Candidatus Paceibacterota bacterium]